MQSLYSLCPMCAMCAHQPLEKHWRRDSQFVLRCAAEMSTDGETAQSATFSIGPRCALLNASGLTATGWLHPSEPSWRHHIDIQSSRVSRAKVGELSRFACWRAPVLSLVVPLLGHPPDENTGHLTAQDWVPPVET